MSRFGPRILILIALSTAACSGPPEITNTGYTGTWRRGSDHVESTIAIVKNGEQYLFRWNVEAADGRWWVNCDWSGRCEEFVDGVKTSDYTFRTWVDPETNHLRVECNGKVTKPKAMDVHYIDELIVKRGGKRLRSITREDSERTYERHEGPARIFRKVSDSVKDPPVLAQSAGN